MKKKKAKSTIFSVIFKTIFEKFYFNASRQRIREADLFECLSEPLQLQVATMGQVCLKDLAVVLNNTVSKG